MTLWKDIEQPNRHDAGFHRKPWLTNDDDSGRCLECNTVLRWVVPVEPDYEAALRLHRESPLPFISGAQCDDELAAVKMLVNAALGIGEDSTP